MEEERTAPYDQHEMRAAKVFIDAGIGGGNDPVGALIASHTLLVAERNELRKENERLSDFEAKWKDEATSLLLRAMKAELALGRHGVKLPQ